MAKRQEKVNQSKVIVDKEKILDSLESHLEKTRGSLNKAIYFILPFVFAITGFFFIQGTSESITDNASAAYTFFGFLMIIPVIFLISSILELKIRIFSKTTKRNFDPLILKSYWMLEREDFSKKISKFYNVPFNSKLEETRLVKILMTSYTIRIKSLLVKISIIIPLMLLFLMLIAFLSL